MSLPIQVDAAFNSLGGSGNPNITATFPLAQTLGNTNIVYVSTTSSAAESSLGDTAGNIYVPVKQFASGAGLTTSLYKCVGIKAYAANSNIVTAAWSGNNGFAPVLGVFSYTPCDVDAATLEFNLDDTGTTHAFDLGSVTQGHANEYRVGAYNSANDITTPAYGSGWSEETVSGIFDSLVQKNTQVPNSNGSTFDFNFSWESSNNMIWQAIAFGLYDTTSVSANALLPTDAIFFGMT